MQSSARPWNAFFLLTLLAPPPPRPPLRPARLEKHFFLNFYGPKPLDGTTVEPFAASTVPRNMSFFNRYLPVTMHSIKDADLMLFMHMKLHIQAMHHNETALVKQLVEVWEGTGVEGVEGGTYSADTGSGETGAQ